MSGVPFEHDGELLAFPFFGGVDFFLPQFLDLEGDGDLDLFVLKPFITSQDGRLEGRLSFFENIGDAQAYRFQLVTSQYQQFDVHNWFYFVDVDADGDFDLYHDNGAGGLALRRNIGTRSSAQFLLTEATVLDRNGQKVANEFSSIPAFVDIDGDGDQDFFTGLSIGTIVFYRNIGTPAAPLFEFETNTWQDLLILSINASTPKSPVHGSNAIEFNDLDNDGDFDFFYGDFFHKSVYHLRNDGDPHAPKVAITDTLWPPPHPVNTRGYNAPRFADVDGDGFTDFFAAVWNQNQNHFLFYRNESYRTAPEFRLRTDNFLSLLDLGSNATPALADLDADGDWDLALGSFDGELLFFENFGALAAPAFRDAPNKFPNLHINGYVITPTLVDIDADRDYDLFAGNYTGTLAFFENKGSPQSPAFVLKTPQFENLNMGLYSAPQFADLDHDGDFDLAVGVVTNGAISFFENVGSATAPSFAFKSQFQPVTGTIDSKPFFYDWDRDGILDLFIGQRNGRLLYYRGTSPQFGDAFELVQREFGGLQVGADSAPVLADLNNDGRLDALIGEEAGGLNCFFGRTSVAVEQTGRTPSGFTLFTHPNPFRTELNIFLRAARVAEHEAPRLMLCDLTGAQVAELPMHEAGGGSWFAQWRTAHAPLRSGLYFLRAQSGGMQTVQKVLLVK